MEEAILKRKMPQQKTIAEWAYRAIIGAKVEAADDLSFMQADLLWQFEDTLTTNYCVLTPLLRKKYRYVRYVAPIGKEWSWRNWHCLRIHYVRRRFGWGG